MPKQIIKIVDVSTGEEIEREMTADELAQAELDAQAVADELASLAEKEAAREAALDKLRAIGLTDDEIAALVGA